MINSQDTLKLLELSDNVKKAFLTWDSYVGRKTKKKGVIAKMVRSNTSTGTGKQKPKVNTYSKPSQGGYNQHTHTTENQS